MTIEEQIQKIREQIRDNGEQAITGDGLGDVLVDMVETLDGAKIGEAPRDGLQYGRKDGAWAEIEAAGAYADLPDKPSINSVTLQDNKTAAQLGLQAEDYIAIYNVTSAEDIRLAYNAGKRILCKDTDDFTLLLPLASADTAHDRYIFGAFDGKWEYAMLNEDDWIKGELELKNNLTTTTRGVGVLDASQGKVLKDLIDGKQDAISDLATIRSNAATGAAIAPKVPAQASSTNQLADKAFVNSTVQTGTANFRGNWVTLAAVPTDASLYPADYAGNHTPTVNDYMVVQSDEEHEGATWRYKYSGDWATDGKDGWQAEYEVNETPMTAAQLAAINSGITAAEVTRLAGLTDKVFVATYGVTTFADIQTAYNAGKEVICNNTGKLYRLALLTTEARFVAFSFTQVFVTTCNSNNVWTNSSSFVENAASKTTSLSSSSTDTQYPSAKAVVDYVRAHSGAIVTIKRY